MGPGRLVPPSREQRCQRVGQVPRTRIIATRSTVVVAAHFAACTLAMLGMAAPGMADTETSFVEMLNTVQRTLAGETISLPDDGSAGGGTSDGGSGSAGPTAEQYWISDVDDIAQGQCKVCHQQGGTAANSGAELVFTGSATQNHAAMSSYVDSPRGNADLVLSKITGKPTSSDG